MLALAMVEMLATRNKEERKEAADTRLPATAKDMAVAASTRHQTTVEVLHKAVDMVLELVRAWITFRYVQCCSYR